MDNIYIKANDNDILHHLDAQRPCQQWDEQLKLSISGAGIRPINYCRFVGESFLGFHPIHLKLMAGEEWVSQ